MKRLDKMSSPFSVMRNQEGAVLPLVGLAMLSLILCAGFAIDYTRAQIVQERLQWALDSAALAGSKAAAGGNNAVKAEAERYFKANFPKGYMGVDGYPSIAVSGATSHFGSASKGFRFTITNVKVPSYLLAAVGWDGTKVGALAEVNTMPLTPLDIVFSFDLSGSMDVTAGKGCMFASYQNPDGTYTYPSYCYDGPDKIDEAKTEMRRLADKLTMKTTRFGLVGWDYALLKKQNFTSGSAIKSAISSMKTRGNTDGALGMREARDMMNSSSADNKAIIFLTDGINTMYYGHGSACCADANALAANQKQREICDNAKSRGVNIYTIAYDLDRKYFSGDTNKYYVDQAKYTLQYCASSVCTARQDRKDGLCFFDAANASQLKTAIDSIGSTMTTVRLTK